MQIEIPIDNSAVQNFLRLHTHESRVFAQFEVILPFTIYVGETKIELKEKDRFDFHQHGSITILFHSRMKLKDGDGLGAMAMKALSTPQSNIPIRSLTRFSDGTRDVWL
jgi:hypothetical protein